MANVYRTAVISFTRKSGVPVEMAAGTERRANHQSEHRSEGMVIARSCVLLLSCSCRRQRLCLRHLREWLGARTLLHPGLNYSWIAFHCLFRCYCCRWLRFRFPHTGLVGNGRVATERRPPSGISVSQRVCQTSFCAIFHKCSNQHRTGFLHS